MLRASILIGLAGLAGCGGGSDDAAPAEYQVSSAFTKLATTASGVYAAKGHVMGLEATLRVQLVPQAPAAFDGVSRESFRVDQGLNVGGFAPGPTESSTLFFSRDPFTLHGVIDGDVHVSPREAPASVPLSAPLGASGRLFVGQRLAAGVAQGLTTVDWSLEQTGKTAHLCLQFGQVEERSFDKYCFGITPSGDTTGSFQAVSQGPDGTFRFE